jgi:hypothetical protein
MAVSVLKTDLNEYPVKGCQPSTYFNVGMYGIRYLIVQSKDERQRLTPDATRSPFESRRF